MQNLARSKKMAMGHIWMQFMDFELELEKIPNNIGMNVNSTQICMH